MLKFMNAVLCSKLCSLLDNVLVNRYFHVFLSDKNSRWRRLNNGLPQGSVLVPILFNLYMSDIPLKEQTTTHHIVECSPLRQFKGGLVTLNLADDTAVEYLTALNCEILMDKFSYE
jgi:hypothetical protein